MKLSRAIGSVMGVLTIICVELIAGSVMDQSWLNYSPVESSVNENENSAVHIYKGITENDHVSLSGGKSTILPCTNESKESKSNETKSVVSDFMSIDRNAAHLLKPLEIVLTGRSEINDSWKGKNISESQNDMINFWKTESWRNLETEEDGAKILLRHNDVPKRIIRMTEQFRNDTGQIVENIEKSETLRRINTPKLRDKNTTAADGRDKNTKAERVFTKKETDDYKDTDTQITTSYEDKILATEASNEELTGVKSDEDEYEKQNIANTETFKNASEKYGGTTGSTHFIKSSEVINLIPNSVIEIAEESAKGLLTSGEKVEDNRIKIEKTEFDQNKTGLSMEKDKDFKSEFTDEIFVTTESLGHNRSTEMKSVDRSTTTVDLTTVDSKYTPLNSILTNDTENDSEESSTIKEKNGVNISLRNKEEMTQINDKNLNLERREKFGEKSRLQSINTAKPRDENTREVFRNQETDVNTTHAPLNIFTLQEDDRYTKNRVKTNSHIVDPTVQPLNIFKFTVEDRSLRFKQNSSLEFTSQTNSEDDTSTKNGTSDSVTMKQSETIKPKGNYTNVPLLNAILKKEGSSTTKYLHGQNKSQSIEHDEISGTTFDDSVTTINVRESEYSTLDDIHQATTTVGESSTDKIIFEFQEYKENEELSEILESVEITTMEATTLEFTTPDFTTIEPTEITTISTAATPMKPKTIIIERTEDSNYISANDKNFLHYPNLRKIPPEKDTPNNFTTPSLSNIKNSKKTREPSTWMVFSTTPRSTTTMSTTTTTRKPTTVKQATTKDPNGQASFSLNKLSNSKNLKNKIITGKPLKTAKPVYKYQNVEEETPPQDAAIQKLLKFIIECKANGNKTQDINCLTTGAKNDTVSNLLFKNEYYKLTGDKQYNQTLDGLIPS